MSTGSILVTGATGMVGGLFAQRAVEQGYRVRALVRAASRSPRLEKLGVEQFPGDLAEPASLPPAVEGMDYVVHTAAHVGDWGPAEKYRAINVFALEHLLNAAERGGRLKRWIQISSLGVYPARDHFGTDETVAPDIQGLDGYTRTKAEAEVLLRQHMTEHKLPAVILRPGFIYGAGDRHVVPRLIQKLRTGKLKIIGDGQKLLNNTYAGNLVDAIFLAIEKDAALGEIFNVRDERLVTRAEFIGAIADYLKLPPPRKVPVWLARAGVVPIEGLARLLGKTEPPLLTRAVIKFMTLNLDYSIDKAKRLLGYQPRVDFRDGIQIALQSAVDGA